MEIGFIGIGNLGSVMVANLLQCKRNIHLYNRNKEKLKAFEGMAVLHQSLASIAAECDIIFSIVSDDKAVNEISLSEDGLTAHMKPGSVHVCLSTIAPATAASLYTAHHERQIDYITATVIGRPEAARAKALTICISGSSEKEPQVLEILKDLGGKNLYQFGPDAKTASTVKVCNNFLILCAIESMGEAFNLAERAGADINLFYQMITETIFNSPIYKNYGRIIIDETYDQPGFTSQLGLKDTKLALRLADETSTTLALADLIKTRFYINHNRGRNHWDWTSIAKVIKEENY
jgi:3-hydroxyisobutyrate dehydrogenase-like beta-hydroxyacid dehydrogenase